MSANRALVGVGAIVVITAVVLAALALGRPGVGPAPTPGPSDATGVPSPQASGLGDLTLTATSRVDGPFDSSLNHAPTAGQAQSKLWFAEGAWWATLIDPASQELRIARLDPASGTWGDTGAVVDARPHVRADALWDGSHLTIVTAGDRPLATQGLRVIQFVYDAKARRFVVAPDYPVTLTATGVVDPVVARDSKGTFWLAYLDQTRLVLRHSIGDPHHWSAAAGPPVPEGDGITRTAALFADGSRVSLVWNRAGDETLRVAEHLDGADPGTWTTSTTTAQGLADAPGGLSIRTVPTAAGSRLFVAFETAPDRSPNANPLAPGAVVLVRETDGTWTSAQLGRVKDHLADPVLAIDPDRGVLVAVASVANSGSIVFKASALAHVAFESGRGTDLIASATDPSLQNPTSTKQDVDLTTGMAVLAADDGTGHYAHGWLGTEAPGSAVSPSPVSPSPSSGPPAAAGPIVLIHDSFDAWAAGSGAPSGWTASSQSGGSGALAITVGPAPAGHSLVIRTTSIGGSYRACTDFPKTTTIVTVTELFRLAGVATSDTTIGSVRGPGGEAASVRVTRHRLLAYYSGTQKVTTTKALSATGWYRSTIVIKVAAKTYDWTVATASGAVVLRVSGIHWRQAAIPAVDSVCAQSPQGRGSAILLDDLEVRR